MVNWIVMRKVPHSQQELPLWKTVSDRRQEAKDECVRLYGAPEGNWSTLAADGYRVTRLHWDVDQQK